MAAYLVFELHLDMKQGTEPTSRGPHSHSLSLSLS